MQIYIGYFNVFTFHFFKGDTNISQKPMNINMVLNLYRPVALHQYYGMRVNEESIIILGIESRFTYGSGTGTPSIGMDLNNIVTRLCTPSIETISYELHMLINSDKSLFNLECVNTSLKFIHHSILIYYAGSELKKRVVFRNALWLCLFSQ